VNRSLFRLCILLLTVCCARHAAAQSAENVFLIINDASPASERVGAYYASKRAIPDTNIVRVRVAPQDVIDRATYERAIESRIAAAIARERAQDRTLFIVLSKDMPLRINGTTSRQGTAASVDSELALLYRKMTGRSVALGGPVANPYFLGDATLSEAKPFTHERHDIFLVTRLDAFTVDDVLRLIDRGAAPRRDGKLVLDGSFGGDLRRGNVWLEKAAARLREQGFGESVVFDATSVAITGQEAVLGYYSWGSNDPDNRRRSLGLSFVPGALAATFVSSDARTFAEPPETWTVGDSANPATFFAGSPHSLTGDLIREGVTGVAGHVAEPYLDGAVRPHILFPAYVAGFSLAEAFYLAMPYLSWQTVVIGDPLCAPFRRTAADAAVTSTAISAETELPSQFSARRVAVLSAKRWHAESISAILRAESRLARDDRAGARQALEQATSLDGRLEGAQLWLGQLYEHDGDYDKAIERYRKVLELNRNEISALNNLAYSLAIRRGAVEEALPFAERAYALAPRSAEVADTFGWILHLRGSHARAARLLSDAAKLAPANAEIRLHAAVVYAAIGQIDAAGGALEAAASIDPAVADRSEARQVREALLKARSVAK